MQSFDVIVIGAGPGGYTAAARAAQLGMRTAVVEKDRLGGMCMNWGCVPSRRLMEAGRLYRRIGQASAFGIDGIEASRLTFNWKKAVAEKDRLVRKLVADIGSLMEKHRVEVVAGEGRLVDPGSVRVGKETYAAGRTIIATGSRPGRTAVADLPRGIVAEIDEFYARKSIPERIVLAGGGTIACELASLLRLIGRTVTIVSPDKELVPWLDGACRDFIAHKFRQSGVRVLAGSRISRVRNGIAHTGSERVRCDLIVNCSPRQAVLPPMDDVPLDLADGFIRTNDFMQTSVPSVYAIGDVAGGMSASLASAQAICAVNHIAGLRDPIDMGRVPSTIYMDPEISMVGATEETLQSRGVEYVKGEFPMSANSKAVVEASTEGFVKILADQRFGELLGVHIVATRASDLIAEAVMCMRTEGTLDDLTRVIHAHPTVSESFLEAGFQAMAKTMHV
ncbi:MAG: FAD-dependent oxidoreductase [Acidobacteriota bacterium]